ncbi:MAG: cytochrome b N-terminal domain-containing protein [Leptolyngbyaceae cyanobacterium bins.59]|nr:cytochrome b N-terminal domain-containing protein [Leptolyngbyaceae cyanobacterium bins.59]
MSYGFILRRLATILSVAILTLCLIAAVTGILLSFYYEPTAGGAYRSLQDVTTEISNGWLVRSLHDIAGNGLIGLALIQMVVMFLGEKFRTSWLTAWISGITLILTGIGLAWTSVLLDWSQLGYWRFRIELGTIEAIPYIGSFLRTLVAGGDSVGSLTVQRLYTLHSYILAIAAVVLAIVHLVSLLKQEQEEIQRLATEENKQLSSSEA